MNFSTADQNAKVSFVKLERIHASRSKNFRVSFPESCRFIKKRPIHRRVPPKLSAANSFNKDGELDYQFSGI